MAELKNTFTGGKMDKDTDERILQNGVYRSALNVSVSTSEDSDVGAAQNILGNTRVTDMALHRTFAGSDSVAPFGEIGGREFSSENYHVASITDPQSNMLYRFIHTASVSTGLWMDRIIQFDPNATDFEDIETPVFIDVFKVESQADIISSSCVGGGSNIIELDLDLYPGNIRQIRWGMKVELPGTDGINADKAVVEHVNYLASMVYVRILPDCFQCSPGVYPAVGAATDVTVTFYGDRNLNFGSFENNEEKNYGLKTITGLNIIDGMIFWTDNFSEPKKVNIKRSIQGSNYKEHGFTIYKDTQSSNSQEYLNGFIHHTLLINSESLTQEEHYIVNTCVDVSGCTDQTAFNYNPLATIDDGSCVDAAFGCTDIAATNYDPAANTNDGSCTYAYDYGCTDPLACNYSAIAIFDDGLCAGYYGCTDATAFNYDAGAGCSDGSCVPVVFGCTDPTALQYDPFANTDDGSCGGNVYGCTDNAAGYFPDINGACNPAIHPLGINCPTLSAPISNDGSFQGIPYGYAVDNFNPDANIDDGSCTTGTILIPGCTDPLACNYDPSATQDDGSCLTIYGCTDATAYNYDPAAQCDDGSCGFCGGEPNVSLSLPSSTSNKLVATVTGGATPYTYQWYEASATSSILQTTPVLNFATLTPINGTYHVIVTDANGCQTTSAGFTIIVGCMDPTACDYDPNANIIWGVTCTLPDGCMDDGSCTVSTCGYDSPYPGTAATNYDSLATCDDGNCIYPVLGCMNAFASNYDPTATVDDGSCLFNCQTNVIGNILSRDANKVSTIELLTTMCNSPNGASAEGSWATSDEVFIELFDPSGSSTAYSAYQMYNIGGVMVAQDATNFNDGIVCNSSGNDITGMERTDLNGLSIPSSFINTDGTWEIKAQTSSPFTCTQSSFTVDITLGCKDPTAANYNPNANFWPAADPCIYFDPNVLATIPTTTINSIPHVYFPDCALRWTIVSNWSNWHLGTINGSDFVDVNGVSQGTSSSTPCSSDTSLSGWPIGEYLPLYKVYFPMGDNRFDQLNKKVGDWTGIASFVNVRFIDGYYNPGSPTHMDISNLPNLDAVGTGYNQALNVGKNLNLTHINMANGNTNGSCSDPQYTDQASCIGTWTPPTTAPYEFHNYCGPTGFSGCSGVLEVCVDPGAAAMWNADNNYSVDNGGYTTFVDTVISGNACDPNEYNGEGGAA